MELDSCWQSEQQFESLSESSRYFAQLFSDYGKQQQQVILSILIGIGWLSAEILERRERIDNDVDEK
jgi:hypothetical protein